MPTISSFKKRLLIATLACVIPLLSSKSHAADLIVIVSNVQQDVGAIQVGLFFNNPVDFPKSITQGITAPAKERDAQGRVRLVFSALPPGEYAATAYHDINGDNKLNTNLMKLPTEPYGFSNNARGSFGPPTFKDAAITIGEVTVTIEFQIK
jgi:uncharacterized protein (DUF2141 family)